MQAVDKAVCCQAPVSPPAHSPQRVSSSPLGQSLTPSHHWEGDMHTPEDPHSIRELRQLFSTARRQKHSHEAARQPSSWGVSHFDGAKLWMRLEPGGGREPSLPQQEMDCSDQVSDADCILATGLSWIIRHHQVVRKESDLRWQSVSTWRRRKRVGTSIIHSCSHLKQDHTHPA